MQELESYKKLVSVVLELSKAKTLNEVTAIVRAAARKLMGSDGATFVLKEDGYCYYADEDAISPLWKGQRFPLENCVSGWAMLNKQPAIIPDIYNDPRVPVDAYRPTFVKSLVMVPIRAEAPIGAIGNYWAKQYTPTEEQVNLIQALADTTAVAMENLQLYSWLEKRIEDLSAANRSKDELLMIVSHELRTPLNAIQGWAQLLTEGSLDTIQEKRAYQTIVRNSRAQARIIDDLLDASRIILGRLELQKVTLNFTEIVRESLDSVKPLADEKALTVEFLSSEEMAKISGHSERLRQVVNNILSNAIKFTPRGGKIVVDVRRVGPNVQLSVSDNGEGIDSQVMPYIFERFRQADSSSTRKHAGLGLGLAIVKYLVEDHHGQVAVKSDGPGRGASFTITLPLMAPLVESKLSPKLVASKVITRPLNHTKILVIDDDPDARDLAEMVLMQEGANVATAENAAKGYQLLSQFSPHILICDISMPGEDGYSVIRKIRSGHVDGFSRIPAVALTAFTDDGHKQMALEAGFETFLGKPFHVSNLIQVVQNLCAKHEIHLANE